MSTPAFAPVEPSEMAGIALSLDSHGLLQGILRDDLALFAAAELGRPLAALVAEGSSEKAQNFVEEIWTKGAAFDWELNLRVAGGIRPLHFAAGKTAEGAWIVGSPSRRGLSYICGWLIREHSFLNDVAAQVCDKRFPDDGVIAEMSRLNNELVNAQRELAKNLARAEQGHRALSLSHAELEQEVARQTDELNAILVSMGASVAAKEETEARLHRLSADILRLQDEERRRLARDLHDAAGQTLAAIALTVGSLREAIKRQKDTEGLLEDLDVLTTQAIREVRTTSYLLHPPLLDEAGFASAAQFYVEGFSKRSGIQVEFDLRGGDHLPRSLAMVLFRVLQESLTNVLRHSGARRAQVRLNADEDQLVFEIRDFGKGMTPERVDKFMKSGEGAGVGLAGMRERVRQIGGRLEIQSGTSGTTVKVVIQNPPRDADE